MSIDHVMRLWSHHSSITVISYKPSQEVLDFGVARISIFRNSQDRERILSGKKPPSLRNRPKPRNDHQAPALFFRAVARGKYTFVIFSRLKTSRRATVDLLACATPTHSRTGGVGLALELGVGVVHALCQPTPKTLCELAPSDETKLPRSCS